MIRQYIPDRKRRNNLENRPFFRKPFVYRYFHATLIIMLINFAVFGMNFIWPKISFYLSLNPVLITRYGMFWQFVTYMFVHQNMSHIICNMLGLLFFGLPLEKSIGSKEFLLFYFVCGILSGILSFAVYISSGFYSVFLMGASGAIYAVLFAYAVFFPRSTIFIWGIIPVPSPILVLIYTVVEITSQLLGRSSNVAHLTHLFGFFAAWLYFVVRMGIHPIKIWKDIYKH